MNAGLERQTSIVEVAPDLPIEVGDRAQLFGIEQMFGNQKQTLVCVHFHLRIADLSCVAQPAEPDLDAHRLLGQVLAHALNLNQMHWHSCHVVFLLSRSLGHPIPNRHRDQILKGTHRPTQFDVCLLVFLGAVRDSRA